VGKPIESSRSGKAHVNPIKVGVYHRASELVNFFKSGCLTKSVLARAFFKT